MPEALNGASDIAIGQAAITAVGALSTAQLLSAVTPERIGELTGYSASSIRYRLNASAPGSASALGEAKLEPPASRARGWRFDRERLLACAVDAYRVHARAARERARDRYLPALADLGDGNAEPLELALEAEIREFTAGDAERLYLIALAGGDRSPAIGGLLRQVEDDRREANRALVHHGLAVLGRRPAQGITADAVAEAVNHYLRGLAQRRGFEPAAGDGVVLRAVLGLVIALTLPASEGPAAPVLDALSRLTPEA